ncbi:serine-rich adhesin for platelets isoform X1 [Anastrepha ludens]|uniref:serine-rich adhesin for platelets isoform X1 n=1 Tax=Anastrepha ludens TaxID=28586 RepID=UPI0023AE7C44|nr:serine-rich adhesin for platelets isoform X1 [Anastrepha ludens]XP_053952049.1 serine-rich adhesin for platelets isoform X1 [Anastrepha ludens]XP_053952050.1 serine-rich adhesin for platelets isoform X1 [Anastrepha ludens]XP_053952051.1 serine-rich adhesin for platelets isoform X1 [Anastrepha ludens]XP_053952052.1 serine-rich adhesin for platelets isoform X1 [Anastrepha ludens]XP_053952053.1 serine-rich adhesin for platelets isoform X1 [Anastrepha ludens]XP_053952054.1 serine-rich adhesin 
MNNEISGKTLLSVTASIAAAIIPDTPIVSIAGATLSEITTTTTSTTTTPTPTPTPTSFIPSTRANKDHSIANLPNNPMSDAAATKSAGGNGTTTANAAATNITTSNVSADAGGIAGKSTTLEHATIVNVAHAGKTDDATTNTTIDTKKSDVSDLEEPDLKKLLEEAYTYKTPKDKKDKSEIFLDLLQKVENEDLGITSTRSDSHRHHPHSQNRHQQKQGGSLQDLLQLPSDYRRQNHTSRHKKNSSVSSRQREGGSLPSNVNVANCLLNSFEQQASVYADKRVRRAFLLGVETATVALNNNNTLVGVVGGNNVVSGQSTNSSGSGSTNSASLCSKESGNSVGASVTSVSGGSGSMATTASGHSVGGTMATGAGIVNTTVKNANSISSSGDYIINIGDMMDIQQQQQILPSKAQDGGQGLPFYERVDIDMRIPRPNLHRGEGGEFAPSRAHHYVDEVIRFHQIDGGEDGMCESGEVAISVNALGNTLKSAAASCSLPMPLDERYRSIKSVMGEKGDGAASLNASVATKTSGAIAPNSISSNNNTNNMGSGSGSSSIGIGSYTKSMPLARQMDENGNDCERQQHSSSSSIIVNAGQSQAKAKAKKKPQKDNTIPVDVENEAGYRGKDPVEVLVKFIESTEEDNKQGGSGGSNNKFAENSKRKERKKEKVKQNKMKKSNSLEELRSCAKIDVGELKQSAATTESNNVTMRSKGTGGGKGAKNNSASTADINKNFDGSSKEVTGTVTTSVGKQAAVVVVTTTTTTATTANNRKSERRSWGTEELQYLGTEGSASGAGSISGSIANSIEEKAKDRKEKKGKEKEKDKERDIDREKDKGRDKEKDKEKTKDSVEHDKLTNNKVDGNTKLERHDKTEKVEKTDKSEKAEKSEKTEKLEKRKKSESILQSSTTPTKSTTLTATNSERQNNQTANTPVFSAIDLLSMNTLISETAEFHVVTKKRKPKKQRASIDETHFTQGANYNNSTSHNNYNYNNNNNNNSNNSGTPIGFSRAHNLVINSQKFGNNNNNNSSTFGSQQQQQSRYKYYNNNTHGLNTYGNGGSNNSNSDGGRLDYHNNYNSNYNNNYANSNNSNHSHQQCGYQQQNQYHHHHHQQQNQHQQQQQQQNVNAHNVSGASTDKSRRKSTSSVPPSEKSDSSDLDSVHSLPIESTAASASKSKQRHKPASSTTTTPETPKSTTSGGSPASAPISYAHIAAAAAVDRWPNLDAANNNNIVTNGSGSVGVTNCASEQPQQHVTNAEVIPASQSNPNNISTSATAVTSSATSSAAKPSKSKKLASKPDFPELVATNAMNATIADINKATTTPQTVSVTTGTPKIISYSQSLVAVPTQLNTAVNVVSTASGEKTAGTAVEAVNLSLSVLASNTVPDVSKVDTISGSTTRLSHQPMQHQQQQQTLQKSKSVEHESYSFNSSNLDQQYPALEKTVKRHSATNVSISPPTAAGSTNAIALAATAAPPTNVSSTAKFNFAAAAKQQAIKGGGIGSQPITTTSLNTTEPPVSELAAQTPQVAATATSSTNYSMTTPAPTSAVSSTNAAIAGAAISVASSGATTTRKVKEKSPTAVYMPTTTNTSAVAQPTTSNISPNVSDAGAINTARKSKKEKAHQMLASEVAMGLVATIEPHGHVAQKSSTATQTQSTSMDVVVMAIKPTRSPVFVAGGETGVPSHTLGKTQRQHMSNSSGSYKNNTASGVTATSQNATTATVGGSISISSASNRPAVIILNDDRSGDSSIEFTFGDFNEDELKFFDESIAEGVDEFAAGYNDEPTQKQSHQQEVTSEVKVAPKTICAATSTASFIDSDIASDMLPGAKAAPAKQSFVDLENSNQISAITAITTKESGNKLKAGAASESGASNNSVIASLGAQNSGNNCSNVGKSSAAQTADSEQAEPLEKQQLLQRRSSETPQLQQLETCNDIETAILAAARAAAEQQHQQPMQPPPPPSQQQQRSYRHKHQHQQQQYRSTSYGNAYDPPPHREHRSQSAYTRDTPNHYQPQQHHYHNQYHQQSQQQQQHYHYHQSGSSNSASRSRSSSSNNNNNSYDALGSTPPPQSPNPSPSVVVNIQRKEFDIHFIPPIMSNAYSALQHNEIIVDFIGSAWEEVAKVTKFYEGQ